MLPSDETLNSYEKAITKYRNAAISFLIVFLKKIAGLLPRFILYLILIWVFFTIHDRVGFEKTLIILLIGIIQFNIFKAGVKDANTK